MSRGLSLVRHRHYSGQPGLIPLRSGISPWNDNAQDSDVFCWHSPLRGRALGGSRRASQGEAGTCLRLSTATETGADTPTARGM